MLESRRVRTLLEMYLVAEMEDRKILRRKSLSHVISSSSKEVMSACDRLGTSRFSAWYKATHHHLRSLHGVGRSHHAFIRDEIAWSL